MSMSDQLSESSATESNNDERKTLDDFLNDLQRRFDERVNLRKHNTQKHEGESATKKREANVKKNAAFVKKLKSVTENQHSSLLQEAACLDQSRYVAEIIQALTQDCKLKLSDIPFVVKFCCHLHQTYDEFSASFAETWQKNCLVPTVKPSDTGTLSSLNININKLRVDIRILAELVLAGIWPSEREGLALMAGQLKALTNSADSTMFTPVIVNFLKFCGPEYSRLIPHKYVLLANKFNVVFPECKIIPAQFQDGCQRLLKEYLNTVIRKLQSDQKEFHVTERQCLKVLQLRGELPADERARWESAKLDLDRLKNVVGVLADLVDEKTPELNEFPDNEDSETATENLTTEQQKLLERQQLLAAAAAVSEGSAPEPPDLFVDESEQTFYRQLPELQAASVSSKDDDDEEVDGEVELTVEGDDDNAENVSAKPVTSEGTKVGTRTETKGEAKGELAQLATAAEDQALTRRQKLTALLESVPSCANREYIDNVAQEFASNGFNGKRTSLRLARVLLAAPRTKGYVLPFYARLIASLRSLMPDLPDKVSNALIKEFNYHIHKKDQVKIESKLKTVRFMGELVKFGVFGKPEVLRCLSTLTRDFQHHSLEMLAALLESCGRQLVRWADTQLKMKLIVDAVSRKRVSQVLDSRYQLLLDNALVCVQKLEETSAAGTGKELGDPLQLYVIYQLARVLNRSTANTVMRRLRMLDWDDETVFDWLPATIVSVVGTKLPYSRLPLLASLISAFEDYGYGAVGIRVVDTILEHIRLSLEYPNHSLNQVRLAESRLLGECYNYRLCDSPVILRTLYLLITLGAGLPDLDPPDSLFRIRMACVILDTCGPYFDRGAHKRKLDTYLLYLQLYYWQKKSDPFWAANNLPFPIDAANNFSDTLELLRPGVKHFNSLASIEKAVAEKEQEMAALVPKPGEQTAVPTDGGESEEGYDEDDEDQEAEEGEQDDDEDDVDDDDDDGEDEEEDNRGSVGEDLSQVQQSQELDENIGATRGPKQLHCPEDDEFMAELEMALVAAQSSAQSGLSGALPSALSDVPSNAIRAAQAKSTQQAQHIRVHGADESSSESDQPKEVVPFVLIARKGTKPHLAPVAVPRANPLASAYLRHREAEEVEKAQLKQRILSHQYRQEREEMQYASMDAEVMDKQTQQPSAGYRSSQQSNWPSHRGSRY